MIENKIIFRLHFYLVIWEICSLHILNRIHAPLEYSGGNILYTERNNWCTEKICRLKSHRLCVILVDRIESRLNIMNLLIEEYDR